MIFLSSSGSVMRKILAFSISTSSAVWRLPACAEVPVQRARPRTNAAVIDDTERTQVIEPLLVPVYRVVDLTSQLLSASIKVQDFITEFLCAQGRRRGSMQISPRDELLFADQPHLVAQVEKLAHLVGHDAGDA